jgi:hypothetical protein
MMLQLAGSLLLALVMPNSPTDEDEWWHQQRKIYPMTVI